MKVLVTGHRGYVGALLVPELLARGHQVVGVDTRWYEGCDFGPAPGEPIPTVNVDVRDEGLELPRAFDAVIHLAALSNDPLGDFDPAITRAINETAAVRLAERAREAGIPRFLFASSCSVYGAGGSGLLDETAPIHPLTPYAVAKAAAEARIADLETPDFCPVFLRPGTAYGASPRLRGDLVVNNLLAHALLDGEVLIKSDGRPWRPIVHVADVALAFCALLEAPATAVSGQAFNIGATAENYRVSQLAEAVARAVPGSRIRYASDAGPDRRTYRVNCDRLARTIPGWGPRWTLDAGIADLAGRFRSYGVTHSQFFGSRYFRLQRIRQRMESGELAADMRWQRRSQRVA